MPSNGDSLPSKTKYRPSNPVACSIASTSPGVSTTHRTRSDRRVLAQISQISADVKFRQRSQRRISCIAVPSTSASRCPPRRSRSSRCRAMRCAVLDPTPGRHLSACRSSSISGSFTTLFSWPASSHSRQRESRRHGHAPGQPGHLFLADFLDPVDRVVERGCNQVFEHLHVVADARIDLDSSNLVAPAQRDLHHTAAGLAGDFQIRKLGLGLLEPFLHLLRLLHQLRDIAFHWSLRVLAGRTEPGTISASNFSCIRFTTGSSATAASASAWARARSSLSILAGVSRSASSLTGLKSILRSSPE